MKYYIVQKVFTIQYNEEGKKILAIDVCLIEIGETIAIWYECIGVWMYTCVHASPHLILTPHFQPKRYILLFFGSAWKYKTVLFACVHFLLEKKSMMLINTHNTYKRWIDIVSLLYQYLHNGGAIFHKFPIFHFLYVMMECCVESTNFPVHCLISR